MLNLLQTIVSLYIVSVSPDYAVAYDADYQLYVCAIPEHCDTANDECLDTYQSFDLEHECFNCSTENNPYTDFCADSIPFEYRQFVNTTFGYIDDNVTVNMMQIVNTDMFSVDDYLTFLDVFSADCLETNESSVCFDALFLAANLSIRLTK